jgi:hypothetical protein
VLSTLRVSASKEQSLCRVSSWTNPEFEQAAMTSMPIPNLTQAQRVIFSERHLFPQSIATTMPQSRWAGYDCRICLTLAPYTTTTRYILPMPVLNIQILDTPPGLCAGR